VKNLIEQLKRPVSEARDPAYQEMIDHLEDIGHAVSGAMSVAQKIKRAGMKTHADREALVKLMKGVDALMNEYKSLAVPEL
jgi:hypothetical protein